jgi:hypothetical protein
MIAFKKAYAATDPAACGRVFSDSLSIKNQIGSINRGDEPCKPSRELGEISYYNSVV